MAATAHGTLTANQVTTVTIDPGWQGIVVVNRDQTGVIWVRLDGQDPVAEAADTFAVFGARSFPLRTRGKPVTVKMRAASGLKYSVEAE